MMVSSLLAIVSTGCVINSERHPRPRDLTEAWQVDRTRILGVRAEPPEIRPGEATRMEALVAHAYDAEPELSLIWLACDDGGAFGCATDLSAFDFEALDPATLREAGFIGFEPGFPPFYAAEPDLLDDLPPEARLEGVNIQTQLFAFPADDLAEGAPGEVDFSEIEVGFKRLVVSEAKTPNNNPRIQDFAVDGIVVPTSVPTIELSSNQQYELSLIVDEATAIEDYLFVNSKGEIEERTEEPYAAWFVTSGEVTEPVTLYPFLDMTWTAPAEPGPGRLWAVLRDRRGGMAWLSRDYVVR